MRIIAFLVSFVIAFLLFSVQPMVTKMVLPTMGGTPAVWNTAMFTFQLLLLLGYGYAHLLARIASPRKQLLLHAGIILAACAFLPLHVALVADEALLSQPVRSLVYAFLTHIGLPFFCLSATAPLLQSWVSRSTHPLAKTPYVLYSASNLGSFAGLIGYVVLVEPSFDLASQSQYWSGLFIVATAALLVAGWGLRMGAVEKSTAVQGIAPNWRECIGWVWLAFLPSSLSLGVTTYITTDVASMPLLWVIPLSLYLLSFVDAFRNRPLLVRACQRMAPILGLAAVMLFVFKGAGLGASLPLQLLVFAIFAFALHGWLASRQPAPAYLTQFYLCLSVGGVLGGAFNGLAAPYLFNTAIEYPMVLLLASLTAFIYLQRRDDATVSVAKQLRWLGLTALLVAAFLLIGTVAYSILQKIDLQAVLISPMMIKIAGVSALLVMVLSLRQFARVYYSLLVLLIIVLINWSMTGDPMFRGRNFFGVSQVIFDADKNIHRFSHDTTVHGIQSLDPKRAMTPLAYYAPLQDVFKALPVTHHHPLAVLGLGAGTLKCFAQKGNQVDLYEINPMVRAIAENPDYFTYLRDCPASHTVLMGDGRIEIGKQPQGRYGAIILDAFSSDSIPGHLLTQEAIHIYLDRLAPGGVLIFNISNRHIDLRPLLGAQAKAVGAVAYRKFFEATKDEPLIFASEWVVIARTEKDLQPLLKAHEGWEEVHGDGNRYWTDQYINLLPYLKALR